MFTLKRMLSALNEIQFAQRWQNWCFKNWTVFCGKRKRCTVPWTEGNTQNKTKTHPPPPNTVLLIIMPKPCLLADKAVTLTCHARHAPWVQQAWWSYTSLSHRQALEAWRCVRFTTEIRFVSLLVWTCWSGFLPVVLTSLTFVLQWGASAAYVTSGSQLLALLSLSPALGCCTCGYRCIFKPTEAKWLTKSQNNSAGSLNKTQRERDIYIYT